MSQDEFETLSTIVIVAVVGWGVVARVSRWRRCPNCGARAMTPWACPACGDDPWADQRDELGP